MGRVQVDVKTAGVTPPGVHEAQITGVKYQIRTGEKWNKDGTTTVEFPAWASSDLPRRTQLIIHVAGHGNMFHNLYDQENCYFMVKQVLDAAGVDYDNSGYDMDDAVGCSIRVEVQPSKDLATGQPNPDRTEIAKVIAP